MKALYKKLSCIFGLFVLLLLVSTPFTVGAATYTWDGGGVDENWTTCGNWSSDICPLTTDSVIFSASSTKDVDIDTDITVVAFSINSGYTGTIAPLASQLITINGAFTQSDGTFTASVATTTVAGNFTRNAGTFNSNNGMFYFLAGTAQSITASSTSFYDVAFGHTNVAAGITSFVTDITIGRNMRLYNSGTGGFAFTIQPNITSNARTVYVAGDVIINPMVGNSNVSWGSTNGLSALTLNLMGNFSLTGSVTFRSDIVFASSSNQTILKTAGTISTGTDLYDTGSGDLILTADFSATSAILHPDDSTDFNFVANAFTFTVSTVQIATGTAFAPAGPSSYVINDIILQTGATFNPNASTTIVDITLNGGTFNGVTNGTTTITGNFIDTSGTFNANNGTVHFLVGSAMAITATSTAFNNVALGHAGLSAGVTTLNTDLNIGGNLTITNSSSGGAAFTVTSNTSVGTPRNIIVAGDTIFGPVVGNSNIQWGTNNGLSGLTTVMYGNLSMATGIGIYSDFVFASSSTQNINKTLGTFTTGCDMFDTGSGNLSLSSNLDFSSCRINTDVATDFNFNNTAFTVTMSNLNIATGTSFNPAGASSYIINNTTLTNGTLNPNASTTFTTAFTLNGGTLNAVSNSTTTVIGNFTYTSGTFNHNDGTMFFQPSASMTLTPGSAVFKNVFLSRTNSGSFNITLASDMTVGGNLYIGNSGSGVMQILSSVSGTPRTVAVAGDLIFPSGSLATVYFGNPNSNTTFLINTTLAGNLWINSGYGNLYSDITFSGTGTQAITISAGAVGSHNQLIIDKSLGTVDLTTALSSAGTLNVATGTLRTAGFTLTTAVSGLTVGAAGTLQIQGGESVSTSTLATSSTVIYEGTSGPYTLKNWSYKNLTIQGNGATFNLPGALTGLQNINIASGTLDVTASNYGMTVQGNWINTGSFTPRSGTVTLSGTNQTVTGTTTFYSLTKSVVTADTLTFGANQTQTISNTWTANGAVGELLSLRSTTPGTRWNINPQSTRTLSYIDVQDSNNTNASVIGAVVGIVDSGNNLNWGFDSTPPGATGIVVTPATSTASVVWVTDESATSTFKYGLTSAYGNASTSLGTSSHAVSISGLTPNTLYHYAVVSSDGGGNTATTTDATFTTNPLPDTTAPIITTGATSTGTTTANIAWTTDESATSTIQYGTTISYGSYATSSGTSTHSVSLTGLASTTIYHYMITAQDSSGNISTTSDAIFTTRDGTSPTISNASSTLVSTTTATITWTTDENSTSVVDYGLTGGYGSASSSLDLVTSHTIYLSGLTPTTLYHFRVTSVDSVGNSTSSIDLTFITATAPDVVAPNITTIASTTSTSTATISWTTTENASSSVLYGTTLSYGSVATSSGTTTHTVDLSGLTPGTAYHFVILAIDSASNSSTTADMLFTTTLIPDITAPTVSLTAPTNLATVSGASVSITANASDDTAVVGVQFKLNTNTNIGAEDTTSTYGVTWDSTSVTDGVHTIIAVARDAAGNYATSTVVNVTVDNSVPVITPSTPNQIPERPQGVWNQPTITGDAPFVPPPQLQPQYSIPSIPIVPPANVKFIFKRDLTQGMNNADVKELQKFLNKNGFIIAKNGPGSIGKETTFFGPDTKAAVLKFQIAKKIKGANGRFGQATRGVVNRMR